MPPGRNSPAGGIHPHLEPESNPTGAQEMKGLKEVIQGKVEEVIRLVQEAEHFIGQQGHQSPLPPRPGTREKGPSPTQNFTHRNTIKTKKK